MIKVAVGCGKRYYGVGWEHIDGARYPHITSHNVVNLPYEDGSVSIIYASHLLEYFNSDEADELIKKWHDKLKPNGVLRIAVPDFEAMAKLYVEGKFDIDSFIGPLYGRMKMGDGTIYHKYIYDEKSLWDKMKAIGFIKGRRYKWQATETAAVDDQSQAYLPKMSKKEGTLISLNMEFIK